MDRQFRNQLSLLLATLMAVTGCAPTQPFYFMEDGDLSHYVDVATQIEYPDVEEPSLDEVANAMAPLTLRNAENYTVWDVSLEEATRITLTNSQVMRQLGGAVQEQAPETLSRNLINSVAVTTTYDPALVESSTGTAFGSQFNGTGVESALSAFDAQLDASVSWQRNDRPQNAQPNLFQPPNFLQDLGTGTVGITKTAATGTQFGVRNNTNYEFNNAGFRAAPSGWNTNFETFINQPLLQGAGSQYNRIAGPFAFDQYASNGVNPFDGVVLARIRTDLTLADFEGGVRNLMRDVEQAYWTLYFSYRDLEARKIGRDSSLKTWQRVAALKKEGARGGAADREAQARAQYFQFKAQVEQGLSSLYAAENRLRYIMGLSVSDGRLIRPADEPTTAQVAFDWSAIHSESMARRVEVRKQKWEIKRRELELIAARNHLLPRLDGFGTYRWVGGGDRLFENNPANGTPFQPGTGAFDVLTGGNYEEWELGLRFSMPIGFRNQMSTVRHHQLLLARERALLQDLELEVSHQLGDAIRDLDLNYGLTETNFNRRAAAQLEVEAVQASYDLGRINLDLLLDAQRRRSDAESAYYRSLVDFNLAITDVHYRKGSLLDYNGVYLAEGPWPGKAHFDALRLARKRDASVALDYGFTRPGVMSRGPHAQRMQSHGTSIESIHPIPTPAEMPEGVELLQPSPAGVPLGSTNVLPNQRQLFAAPGAGGAQLANAPTGYEPASQEPKRFNTSDQQLASTPVSNPIHQASATVAAGESGVVTAGGVIDSAYEHQAGYTVDRPAAEVAVGSGGER